MRIIPRTEGAVGALTNTGSARIGGPGAALTAPALPEPARRSEVHEATCTACGESKPTSAFYRNSASPTGLRKDCKACDAAASKEWRARNKEAIRERQAKWAALNRDRVRRNSRKYRESLKGKRRGRADHLMRRYGLTEADYEEMAAAQDNLCAVCGLAESIVDHRTSLPKRLSVDHDHTTGEVRSLLCYRCNTIAGRADDDPDLLRLLAAYLEAFK